MNVKQLSRGKFELLASTAFLLIALLQHNATASVVVDEVVRFGICSGNFKSVIIVKGTGAEDEWHLAITLNNAGAKQFQSLQNQHHDKIVELVFDGASLGRARLNGPITLNKIHFMSQRWSSLGAAEAQMELLGNKTLDVPCGLIES